MRLSNYNYIKKDGKNQFIYNTLSNRIVKLSDFDDITCIQNKEFEKISEHKLNLLKEAGIVTDLSVEDEYGLCNDSYFGKVYSGVLDITLITTTACNFRCKYCAQTHTSHVMSKEVYENLIKYIIKHIYEFHTLKLVLFGGEPTLAFSNYIDYLDRILDICRFYKKRFSGVMISNAYLLDDKMLRELYKRNITQYQITVDGSPENHDECRVLADGSGTFQTVYNNLLNMLEAKELKRLNVAIRINTTKELLEDIDSWAPLYEPFSKDKRFLINLGVVEDRGGEAIRSFHKELINETDHIYKTAKDSLAEHRFYEDFLCPNYFVCKEINKMAFALDYNGDVRTCSKIYTDNVKGVLNKKGIIEVNDKFKQFYLKTNTACQGCVFEPLCQGKSCGLKNVCDKEHIEIMVNDYIEKQAKQTAYQDI